MSEPVRDGAAVPDGDERAAGRPSGARAALRRRWPVIVLLTVMWIALWGTLSIANILGGLVVSLVVLRLVSVMQPGPFRNFDAAGALRYLVTFIKLLFIASYQVAVAVVRPERIKPGILALPLHRPSDAVITLVANSITLTPGTLTLDAERKGDDAVLYVHALDVSDVEAVRGDVRLLERLAADAFGSPEMRAVVGTQTRPSEDGDGDRAAPPPATTDDTTGPT